MDDLNLDGVAVVVVNYHSADMLRRNILEVIGGKATVIVADNSVHPSEKHQTKKLCATYGALYHDSGGNVGFGRAVNLACSLASSEGLRAAMLMNPDASIELADLSLLAKAWRANPLNLYSPRIVDSRGDLWFDNGQLNWTTGIPFHGPPGLKSTWATGACLMVDLEGWRAIGGFDESYFLYWEDVDFTYRWTKQRGDVRTLAQASARHDVGGTQEASSGKSTIYLKYNARNRFLFARRHLPARQRMQWLLTTPRHAQTLWCARGVTRWKTLRALMHGYASGMLHH